MLVLIGWIVVVVLAVALVVLGAVVYGVVGAFGRLGREAAALEREARPVLDQIQAVSDRAAETPRVS